MEEELGYVPSSDVEQVEQHRVSTDEANLDTLVLVRKMLNNRISMYSSVSRLDVTEKVFPIKTQLAIYLEVAKRLKEVELVVTEAIGKVKEIQNERR